MCVAKTNLWQRMVEALAPLGTWHFPSGVVSLIWWSRIHNIKLSCNCLDVTKEVTAMHKLNGVVVCMVHKRIKFEKWLWAFIQFHLNLIVFCFKNFVWACFLCLCIVLTLTTSLIMLFMRTWGFSLSSACSASFYSATHNSWRNWSSYSSGTICLQQFELEFQLVRPGRSEQSDTSSFVRGFASTQ